MKIKSYTPIFILILGIIPLSIIINPDVIPRFLGEISHLDKGGYLDLEHYINISQRGREYAWQTAFYPLWPFVLSVINRFSSIDSYKISIFTSIFFGISSLLISKRIFKKISRNNINSSISWSLYVLSPMTIFLFNGYTESIFAFFTWILMALIINAIEKEYKYIFSINYIFIFIISCILGLTRPSIIQAFISISIALILTLILYKQKAKMPSNIYIYLSIYIALGFFIGYLIYGLICINDGYRFLEPFYSQQLWQKSLGFRPILFLTSRSAIVNYWGLYYPFIIIIAFLNKINLFAPQLKIINSIFFKNTFLTILYTPIGFIYGLSNLRNIKNKNTYLKNKLNKDTNNYIQKYIYLFLFSSFFAFSHSLICLFTCEISLMSLGRFVFGQPYFYVAFSILINAMDKEEIKYKKLFFIITLMISGFILLENFVDFGNAKLHV